jgi:hypothetical protein
MFASSISAGANDCAGAMDNRSSRWHCPALLIPGVRLKLPSSELFQDVTKRMKAKNLTINPQRRLKPAGTACDVLCGNRIT